MRGAVFPDAQGGTMGGGGECSGGEEGNIEEDGESLG